MPKHKLEDIWYDEDTEKLYRRTKDGFEALSPDITISTSAPSGGEDGDVWIQL